MKKKIILQVLALPDFSHRNRKKEKKITPRERKKPNFSKVLNLKSYNNSPLSRLQQSIMRITYDE